MKAISDNWQRVLFAAVGCIALYYSFLFVREGKVTEASAVFAIAFLSMLYSNLTRFKRFKGLGFEAELWEDKQREAADLIDRLKTVVSIYTNEIVMGSVRGSRLSDGPDWQKNWALFNGLVEQHQILGQKIDFSDLKKRIDDYFLYDMCMRNSKNIYRPVNNGINAAREKINKQFGSPIEDINGYNARLNELQSIERSPDNHFKIGQSENLAKRIIAIGEAAKLKLRQSFDVDIVLDGEALSRLTSIAHLYDHRPVKVTDVLISWAEKEPPAE
ncbi:hypothetical protein [Rhizobium leguminosarum]|uniref:hypothetical protein n=1 Tax=Rhizobium leguminosarum TaxID=384 RepID=UPI001C93B339|nr:hypothetical protein [Rhizobium leguminosarum]MBY5585335.1 hypothetical protein [Rhizobium leguminosarum]